MGDRTDDLCFEKNSRKGTQCAQRGCRYWISHPGEMNCTLIAASRGPMTLQQIGEIMGVTRMRVCQLEKRILDTVREDSEMTRAT